MVHDLDSLNDDTNLSVYHGIPSNSKSLVPSQQALVRMRKHHQQEAIIRFRRKRAIIQYIIQWRHRIIRKFNCLHNMEKARKHALRKALGVFLQRAIQTCSSKHLESIHDERYMKGRCQSAFRRLFELSVLRRRACIVSEYYTENRIRWRCWKNAFFSRLKSKCEQMAHELCGEERYAKKRYRRVLNVLFFSVKRHRKVVKITNEVQEVLRSKDRAVMRQFYERLVQLRFFSGICMSQAKYFRVTFSLTVAVRRMCQVAKSRRLSRRKNRIGRLSFASLCLHRWRTVAQRHMNRYYRQARKHCYRATLRRSLSLWQNFRNCIFLQKRIYAAALQRQKSRHAAGRRGVKSCSVVGRGLGLGRYVMIWRENLRELCRQKQLHRKSEDLKWNGMALKAIKSLLVNVSLRRSSRSTSYENYLRAWNHFAVRVVKPHFSRWREVSRRQFHSRARYKVFRTEKLLVDGMSRWFSYHQRSERHTVQYNEGFSHFEISAQKRAVIIWRGLTTKHCDKKRQMIESVNHFRRKRSREVLCILLARVCLRRQHIATVNQRHLPNGRLESRAYTEQLDPRSLCDSSSLYCASLGIHKAETYFIRERMSCMVQCWKNFVKYRKEERGSWLRVDRRLRVVRIKHAIEMFRHVACQRAVSMERAATKYATLLFRRMSLTRYLGVLKTHMNTSVGTRVAGYTATMQHHSRRKIWALSRLYIRSNNLAALSRRNNRADEHLRSSVQRLWFRKWRGRVRAKRNRCDMVHIKLSEFRTKLKGIKLRVWIRRHCGVVGIEIMRGRNKAVWNRKRHSDEIHSIRSLSYARSDRHVARRRMRIGIMLWKKYVNKQSYISRMNDLVENLSPDIQHSDRIADIIETSIRTRSRIDRSYSAVVYLHYSTLRLERGWTEWLAWFKRRKLLQVAFHTGYDRHCVRVKRSVFMVFVDLYKTSEAMSEHAQRCRNSLLKQSVFRSIQYLRDCSVHERASRNYSTAYRERRLCRLYFTDRLLRYKDIRTSGRLLVEYAIDHKTCHDEASCLRRWSNAVSFRIRNREKRKSSLTIRLKSLWFPRLVRYLEYRRMVSFRVHTCDTMHRRTLLKRALVNLRNGYLCRARNREVIRFIVSHYQRRSLSLFFKTLGSISHRERLKRSAMSHYTFQCRKRAIKSWKSRVRRLICDHNRGSVMYRRSAYNAVFGTLRPDTGKASLSPLSQRILLLNSHSKHTTRMIATYLYRWTVRYRVLQSGELGSQYYKRRILHRAFKLFERRIYERLALHRTGDVLYGAWKRIMRRRGLSFFKYHTLMCKVYKQVLLLRKRRFFDHIKSTYRNATLGRKFIHLIFSNLKLRVQKELSHIIREWKVDTIVERNLEGYLLQKERTKKLRTLRQMKIFVAWKVKDYDFKVNLLTDFFQRQLVFFKKRGLFRLRANVYSSKVQRKCQFRAQRFSFECICTAIRRRGYIEERSMAANQRAREYHRKSSLLFAMAFLRYHVQKLKRCHRHMYAIDRWQMKYKLRVGINALLNNAVECRRRRYVRKKILQFNLRRRITQVFHVLDSRVCAQWAEIHRVRLMNIHSQKFAMLRAIKNLQHNVHKSRKTKLKTLNRALFSTSALGIPIS